MSDFGNIIPPAKPKSNWPLIGVGALALIGVLIIFSSIGRGSQAADSPQVVTNTTLAPTKIKATPKPTNIPTPAPSPTPRYGSIGVARESNATALTVESAMYANQTNQFSNVAAGEVYLVVDVLIEVTPK